MFGPRRSLNRGKRTIRGIEIQITELVWPDDARSFEVIDMTHEVELTVDECFDDMPSDGQIETLLEMQAERERLN